MLSSTATSASCNIAQDVWKPVVQQVRFCFMRMAPSQHRNIRKIYEKSAINFCSMVIKIHNYLNNTPNLLSEIPTSAYFKRSIYQLQLPIARDSQGHVYAILKSRLSPSSFAEGEVKIFYYAIRLPTTQCPLPKMFAWAKMHFDNLGVYDEIVNEINARKYFEGDQRLPKIFQVFLYESRNQEEMSAGMLMELCTGDITQIKRSENGEMLPDYIQNGLWNIIEDFFSVLVRMEELGIVHRDLKSENICFAYDAERNVLRGKLADFALLSSPQNRMSPDLGNLLHKAPEFCTGLARLDQLTEERELCEQRILRYQNAEEIDKLQGLRPLEQGSSTNSTYESQWAGRREEYAKKINDIEQEILALNAIFDNPISEVWSAGMVLLVARCGFDLDMLILDPEYVKKWGGVPEYMREEFIKQMQQVTQSKINKQLRHETGITAAEQVCTLQDLNLYMLTVDPAQRPSAKVCLQLLQELRSRGCSFS